MQIEKVLIVESPVHLFRLIRAKEEIMDMVNDDQYFMLLSFVDSADLFINGCKCEEEENYANMVSRYVALVESSVPEKMIEVFECDRIEFK